MAELQGAKSTGATFHGVKEGHHSGRSQETSKNEPTLAAGEIDCAMHAHRQFWKTNLQTLAFWHFGKKSYS